MERIEIRAESPEEYWTLNFLNFSVGAKQLLLEGLTHELPV